MKTRIVQLALLLVISLVTWFLQLRTENIYVTKTFYTVLALLIIFTVIKVIFEQVIIRGIKESKTRYSLKRLGSMLAVLIFIAAGVAIWVDNLQALLVSYGILAAGMAVALQDVFRNFAGSIMIFVVGTYHIGDRIEVSSKIGDVIDIGLFYTTLLETNEWVGGDQATGRLSTIPNSFVLSGIVNNYTRDHPYVWDEMVIPITYDSDWKKALEIIGDVVVNETREFALRSEESVSKLADKYYLPQKSTESTVFMTLTDNWIDFHVRYIAEVRQRRSVRDRLNRKLLVEIEKVDTIKIASESIDVHVKEFPEKG